MHVLIIPGYGTPVVGRPSYETYIQQAIAFLSEPQNGVDVVVATGGFTHDKDKSEAAYILEYIAQHTNTTDIDFIAEECSIISWQNIMFTAEVLKENNLVPSRITVCGDTARENVLMAYTQYQFAALSTAPHIEFQGYDFGTTDYITPDTHEEIIAMYIDRSSGNAQLRERIERWSIEFGYDVEKNLIEKGCRKALPTA